MAKHGQRGGRVDGDHTLPYVSKRMARELAAEPLPSDRQRTLIDKKQMPGPPFAAHQPSAAKAAAVPPPPPPPAPPAAHAYGPPAKPPRQVEAPTESDLVSHDFGKRYRLGKPLGSGAMGEVLVTRDLR